jgi:tetratricopeptide (TPR) repeat protein
MSDISNFLKAVNRQIPYMPKSHFWDSTIASKRFCKLCRLAMAILIAYALIAPCYGQSLKLLKRSRNWWEWVPDAKPTSTDHLGQGWDDIYLAERSTSQEKADFLYRQAEQEFRFNLLERVLPYCDTPKFPSKRFLGSALGLATVGKRIGKPTLANSAYLDGIRCIPSEPLVYIFFAMTLEDQKNYDLAIRMAKRGVELRPNHAEFHAYLSSLYSLNNQQSLADEESTTATMLGLRPGEAALLLPGKTVSAPQDTAPSKKEEGSKTLQK